MRHCRHVGGPFRPRLLEVNFGGDWHTVMDMVPGDEARNQGFANEALEALVRSGPSPWPHPDFQFHGLDN